MLSLLYRIGFNAFKKFVSLRLQGPSTFAPKVTEKKRAGAQAMEKMPKLEDLVTLQPMKESQTMFGAFSNVKENGTKKVKSVSAHGDDGLVYLKVFES